VYAVTGANGSGKSSLFGIIASCGKQATMLPEGLNVLALDSLVLPSDDVVEITQHLYCSLFTSPLSWLLRRRDVSKLSKDELSKSEELIRKLSVDLQFHSSEDAVRSTSHSSSSSDKAFSEAPLGGIAPEELHAEVDDWYGTLSGGQRGKAEFMRQVFMKDQCPGILIIDEAFAPLDPKSKMLVQRKLKEFCAESLVLVIYHSDAHDSCVTAGGFFDDNLHFSNGTVSLKGLCQEQGLKAD
jgi:energy-coupling factor transporter ATP-binding protein EcfA2